MRYVSNKQVTRQTKSLLALLAFFCIIAIVCAQIIYAATEQTTSDNRKLLNGSFEEGQTWTEKYKQPLQSDVPVWNTTAFQGKIELFRTNTSTYISGVTLAPTHGNYAAELNADEESTLFQNVKTTPSSIYEWGLDHGGRNGMDTMALVIGPKQNVNPSKPSKNGRDQFMQMIDWLIAQGMTSFKGKDEQGLGEQLKVYSKKFAEKGTFENNAGNDAFSLTPSSIYTEEWSIWIIADGKATTGTNPWASYGSNAEESDSSSDVSGNPELDLSKYYFYTVPAGQTETVFGFVSVGYVESSAPPEKAKTYGNFLDNINFQIFHPLSGSSTNHGSAIVGGSDGTVGGEGASDGHEITVNHNLKTYITDGETLKIQAIVKAADVADGSKFVGIYLTKQDENGNPVSKYIQVSGNVIEDSDATSDEAKKDKWVKSTNENGDTVYTYYLESLTSATDLHFIFIKNPTVTYDPNGGKPYIIEDRPHPDEDENVYSFKPLGESVDENSFVKPYVSKAAEGQNDGWKFVGWKLMGDVVDNISSDTELVNADKSGSLMLPAEHTIACDYNVDGATTEKAAQYFKIYNGNVTLDKELSSNDSGQPLGVTWKDNGEEKVYANIHRGITMVAQWRWRQAFIPQVAQNDEFVNSTDGGTVEIISVTDKTDENYNDAYNLFGGKSYHAAIDETVIARAVAKDGCKFIGWYDESGNLITTNYEYGYVESKESVNTFYARFSNTVTQTYIRQIKNGDSWEDTTDDNIATLERYSYTDVVGSPISTTADTKKGYKFVGWYDSDGNKVSDDMLTNGSLTLSYTTTGDATYYARFEDAYTLIVSKIDGESSTANNKVPLAGAQFTLYTEDAFGNKTIIYEEASIKCSTIGTAVTVKSSNGKTATAVFQDKLDKQKNYYLVETKAPAGYRLLNAPIKITIDDSGDNASIDGISKEITEKKVNIELANFLTLHVPTSGSITTGSWFLAAGLMLLGAATTGLFWFEMSRLRRKIKNERKIL